MKYYINDDLTTYLVNIEKLHYDKVEELRKDNKRLQDELQAVNNDYNNDHKVHNEYEDGLLEEINELKAENEELKEGLSNEGVLMLQDDNKRLMSDNKKRLNEIIELQAEIKSYIEARKGRINKIDELKADNKRLNNKDGLYDEVKELQADNDALKEQVNDLMIDLKQAFKLRDKFGIERDAYYDEAKEFKAEVKRLNDKDGLYDEVKELQADNKRLLMNNESLERYNKNEELKVNKLLAEVRELKADNERLRGKYALMKSLDNYPKEYKAEAVEYFSHNPNAEKLWFFMVGDSEVDEDGDIRRSLNVGVDAIAECDNFNGAISVEVYK